MANISSVLTVPAARRVAGERTPLAAVSAVPLIVVCAVAAAVVVNGDADDRVTLVAVTALAGIALAAVRWTPDHRQPAWRPLTMPFAASIVVVAAALVAVRWIPGVEGYDLVGPATTSAVVATYLVTWGFRSQPLLRTIAVLSALTWSSVAATAYDVVHASLQTPSELVYRRLAELRVFGIGDEPWRLFTAELHRGTIVVIATVVLCSVVSRRRAPLTAALELLLTVCAALIVHHAIVLASPLDQYATDTSAPLSTLPVYELAIAAGAAVALGAVRQLRRGDEQAALPPSTVDDELAARDPVIFGVEAGRRRVAVALTFSGLAPLLAVTLTA